MFSSIMTPVDLAHLERLRKSLDVAAGLARQYDARVTYVAVTTPEPTSVAHSPEEFADALTRSRGFSARFSSVTTKIRR